MPRGSVAAALAAASDGVNAATSLEAAIEHVLDSDPAMLAPDNQSESDDNAPLARWRRSRTPRRPFSFPRPSRVDLDVQECLQILKNIAEGRNEYELCLTDESTELAVLLALGRITYNSCND
jgi:hypothetical protein